MSFTNPCRVHSVLDGCSLTGFCDQIYLILTLGCPANVAQMQLFKAQRVTVRSNARAGAVRPGGPRALVGRRVPVICRAQVESDDEDCKGIVADFCGIDPKTGEKMVSSISQGPSHTQACSRVSSTFVAICMAMVMIISQCTQLARCMHGSEQIHVVLLHKCVWLVACACLGG